MGRKWTDITGKFSVEAELVDVGDGKVRLKKENGKVVSIPIERLSLSDRSFVDQQRLRNWFSFGDPQELKQPQQLKQLKGQITHVIDGDTIKLQRNGKIHDIRLEGIDCPELGQRHGDTARQFMIERCIRNEVTVRVTGNDRDGLVLGYVVINGADINLELVEFGLAWWYWEHSDDVRLAKAHVSALHARRGIWEHQRSPQPPWDWRKRELNRK